MTTTSTIRKHLKDYNFTHLFVEELGWDRLSEHHNIPVDGQMYVITPVAHKRLFKVFVCKPDADGKIPDRPTRLKIEREVTKVAQEHLIVFVDAATQRWQWAKREGGKRVAVREETWTQGQSGERLAQKIRDVAFALDEEERLDIVAVKDRVTKAFDVEKVTKKFYELFKTEHDTLLKFLKGIPDQELARWYVSVLLNRLMFIYFIQHKDFLNNDTSYLRKLLTKSMESGDDQFYNSYLCPLFFVGFAQKDHPAAFRKKFGDIPYLNGGIFQQHQIEELHGETIRIPDRAFEQLFSFFENYQWRLDERPLRQDNEINPDVLGYIFEKYINQKQMGAYYTKEDITGYICRNTILPRLSDMARERCRVAFEGDNSVWKLLRDDPDRYIYDAVRKGTEYELPEEIAAGLDNVSRRTGWNVPAPDEYALPTEIWREVVARRKRYQEVRAKLAAGEVRTINDLITLNLDIERFAQDVIETSEGPELVRAFWRSIVGRVPEKSNEKFEQGISILDPTCGSGAFLFAALNILEPLYEACLNRMESLISEADALAAAGEKSSEKYSDFRKILAQVEEHPNRRYFIYKSIIVGNLFGVDIMEEATEICKLRLFLKLAAQVDDRSKMEPLPDIDFNIRAGNALVGFATREEVTAAITEAGGQQRKLIFDTEEEILGRIEQKADDIDILFREFRRQQTVTGGEVTAQDKEHLKSRLGDLAEELNSYLARQYGIDPTKVKKYDVWRKSHQPFHWFVEFYGILSKGGFDVVVGNPPYVEYRTVKSMYQLQPGLFDSEPADNLYAFCLERSSILLGNTGWFGMIVPAGLMGLDDAATLREVLFTTFELNCLSTYGIRPSKLFDGVDQRLCIYISKKGHADAMLWATKYHHWSSEERSSLLMRLQYYPTVIHSRLNRLPQLGNIEAVNILQKIEMYSKMPLAAYYAQRQSAYLLHYHRSPRYWIRAMDFDQYFKSATRSKSIHHFRDIRIRSSSYGKVIGAILNSGLYFFWFISVGNGRNLTSVDVEQFPVGDLDMLISSELPKVFTRLMNDYQKHSVIRQRKDCEFQEFHPSASKSIVDEVDSVLAKHYNFTDEELDFIINYDIKYRMGIDGGEEE